MSGNICLSCRGPKTGSNRAQKYGNNFRRCFGLSGFFIINIKFLGVLIIPKSLILTPGHVAILFGWFLELPTNRLNLDPRTPNLSPKYLKKTRKNGNILENIMFYIWESAILKILEAIRTTFFEILEFYHFKIVEIWNFEK